MIKMATASTGNWLRRPLERHGEQSEEQSGCPRRLPVEQQNGLLEVSLGT